MAKDKLKDIPDFNKRFWKNLGDEVSDKIRVDTTKTGKDVHGKKFEVYNTDYKKRKTAGKFKRQSSRSSKVDLQLTGDMMRNLQTRKVDKNKAVIGWSGTNAQKIQWNADMGREVSTSTMPVSKGNQRFILKEVDKFIETSAKRVARNNVNFTIGK